MALVKGINKQFIIAKETTFGTIAASGGASQVLRRVNGAMVLTKDAIRSQEILPSQQIRDARHGSRRVAGNLTGQLSPSTYVSFMEGLLRKNFTAGATTGAITVVTAAAGPPGTFTRASGSYITDGFKVGDVVRWTGWTSTGTANNTRNYRIKDLTATVMTVTGTGNEVVAAKASGDSVTCTVVGKKAFMPASGQTSTSFSIEQWYPDATTPISERFVGCRVQSMRFNLPATGLLTVDTQIVGQDMQEGTSAYFSSPTAVTATNSLMAVNGTVKFNGADIALITGASFQIASSVEANPVVGSNIVPEIFMGTLTVDGQMSIYVQDQTIFDLFLNENEVDLSFYLTADGTVNSSFINVVMNRVKLFSATKNDSDRSIMQAVSFQALEHVTGAGSGTKYEATTITIQDSDAP